jgi:predicted nucleic acid-binding protein
VVQFYEEIKNLTIEIRRESKIRLPDSIGAATSVFLNMTLVTADKGFKNLKSGNTLIIDFE